MPVLPGRDHEFTDLPGRLSSNPLPAGLEMGCSVRVVRIAPGARTPHRHPRSAEIVYVASGRGVAWEDGESSPVAAGDVIAVPRGVPNATAAAGDELVLICFFPDGDLASNLEELDEPQITA